MEKIKNKGGRPQKNLTKEQIIQVEALAAVLSVDQIADYFSLGKTVFYKIMERQPEVKERYKKGKAKAIGNAANVVLDAIRGGNLTAAFFYLKTQGGWREAAKADQIEEKELDPVKVEIVRRQKND